MARPELLSVVIPCYGSSTYLSKTVAELSGELEGWCPFEIILVNDCSPGPLQQEIDRLAAGDARIRFVELGANRGQHYATLRGFSTSRGDCVVTVDDDGQNPPSAVKAVAERLEVGDLDVVYGSFKSTEQPFIRRLASRANPHASRGLRASGWPSRSRRGPPHRCPTSSPARRTSSAAESTSST